MRISCVRRRPWGRLTWICWGFGPAECHPGPESHVGAVSRDDRFMRVLISLGLSFLFPEVSFRSSKEGLLE